MDQQIELIYIAGCDRSGSTLLDRLLDQLDGVVSIGEVRHLFYGDMKWEHLCGCGKRFSECNFWDNILDDNMINKSCRKFRLRDFKKVKRQIEQQDLSSFRCIRDKAKKFYSRIHKKTGNKIIVDSSKSPTHALILSTLRNVNLTVIHLVRDSRGVAYSWGKDKVKPEIQESETEFMDKHNVLESSLVWNYAQKTANNLKSIANNFIELKYEDLVENVEEKIQLIQKSLGLNFDIKIKNNIKINNIHTISGNPMRMEKEISIKKDKEWECKMNFIKRELVTFMTYKNLKKYDYLR